MMERTLNDIVTESEIIKAFGYSNFGTASREEIIFDTLKKVCQGYSAGHTAISIVRELGLVTLKNRHDVLSDAGLDYLLIYANKNQP